ncbi:MULTISPECIES: hypothetical protein [Cellulophaga]|uniref:hypothetical protein n=1 Tax=Cellulophaga TaxID=104264 RepID=UPI000C2C844B|nr:MULTISPECIES: hypothetical protein [Cellulophaga]PKB43259.1 hypothetical protein AX016_1447 [Cellulophaga sp. RHA19]WBU90101.1 hypothetical protein PBN93_03585 [Cellulophaga omnivescoria]
MTQDEAIMQINHIKDIQKERLEKHYSWVKTLLTLSVGLFGILIAFKTDQKEHIIKSVIFLISLSSLGMGILFSLIHLYAEINILDRLKKFQIQRAIKLVDGMTETISDFENISPKWIYRISGKLNILFFLISLFSLIGYSSFDIFYKLQI